ncbi:MAG TPA: imidazole glycerol phosphate synthase subunit HisH [Gemmatimonadaceae bacterium]
MLAMILDCGIGNLHSLTRGLQSAGFRVRVEREADAALDAELLVLPGVGAWTVASSRIASVRESLRARLADGLPCLAICLGMQLLLKDSAEGSGEGIGLVAGSVTKLGARRVPHTGWNAVESGDALLRDAALRVAYFTHNFACRPPDPSTVIAWTSHDSDRFPAAIQIGRTLGVQFHAEKSSREDIGLLRRFGAEVAA